ncbi:hypothetical protein IM676_11260 [Anabaenopsis elenkinii CCIBt3563]|jgi:hypothetical protein|uniref:Uncharacterized protein n=2 Tax=Anabaenopsis TaxID=110103 RepID=A0A7U3NL75_9CYAN|nr:hypothetical protein IM676_11260 [Anabaenopsis elenkinii CCIBt3563]
MHKTTVLTLGFSCLLLLPATAQLGQVWTEFQFYSVDMQNYLRNHLTDTLKPLENRGQNALNNATGSANIPNPIQAGNSFYQDMIFNPTTDRFENNPVLRSHAVTQEMNRLITRGAVESYMGKDGQTRIKSKLQNTETTLNNISELSQSSNNIFQRLADTLSGSDGAFLPLMTIQKDQAGLQLQAIKIQQEQAKISGETLAQSILTHQSLQYSNLNLVNISQQMEDMNRTHRVDTATEAARFIRNTSQTDLFGR